MYQVLVQYLEERYASFFCESAITVYDQLLEKIKEAIPSLKQLSNEQIRIAYKDVQSNCYINIEAKDENLHLCETFRNCIPCGSHERVQLKVWEMDSPFLIRKRNNARLRNDNDCEASNTSETRTMFTRDHLTMKSGMSSRSLFKQASSADLHQITDWKENKKDELITKIQLIKDKKMAIETHIRELEIDVPQPLAAGTYRTICGNCHIRGHRADGNRRNDSCNLPPCTSYYMCGQRKKHPEHFDEIRNSKKQLKDVNKEIESAELEKKNIESFQSKSISAFSSAVTPRLLKTFGEKYSLKTSTGKLCLQKDIAALRAACDNKIPDDTGNDRELFTTLLDKQSVKMNSYKPSLSQFSGTSCTATCTSSANNTDVTVNISPVKSKRKSRYRRYYSSNDSDTDSSKSRSTTSDSSTERRRKRKKSKRERRDKTSKRKKSSRGQRKRKRNSSSTTSTCDENQESSSNILADKTWSMPFSNNSEKTTGNFPNEPNKCSLDELATIAVAINTDKTPIQK